MTFPNRGIVAPVYAAAACRFITHGMRARPWQRRTSRSNRYASENAR
jgi:hypothetical protein